MTEKKLKRLRAAKKNKQHLVIEVGYNGPTGLAETYTVSGVIAGIWSVPGEGYTIELNNGKSFRLVQIETIL